MGMGGPLWTIRTHDTRVLGTASSTLSRFSVAHRHGLLKDGWWNLHCRLALDHPPGFDPWAWVSRTTGFTGFSAYLDVASSTDRCSVVCDGWVGLGDVGRVRQSRRMHATMHWYISDFAHTRGPQSWLLDGAGVQAHDVPIAAIPTMGESWHNSKSPFTVARGVNGSKRRQRCRLQPMKPALESISQEMPP